MEHSTVPFANTPYIKAAFPAVKAGDSKKAIDPPARTT